MPPRSLIRALVLRLWWSALVAAPASGTPPPPLSIDNPSPGVFVHYGSIGLSSPANRGDIANLSFVVGTRCVAVIDTGGSMAVGRDLLRAVRAVTGLPVCYVINTHGHPDHVFGNAAFRTETTEFVGHARLAEALRRRGPNYLNAALRDIGAPAEGTQIIAPTIAVETETRLDLGGRALIVNAWPTAHTDQDLTVWDETSQTLWLGDLAFVGHLPVVDGSLRGYLTVLGEIKLRKAKSAIPGHGRITAWPQSLAAQQRYLERLAADVRSALRAKKSLTETLAAVSKPGDGDDGDHWLLVDDFHARNVTAAYAELEWEE